MPIWTIKKDTSCMNYETIIVGCTLASTQRLQFQRPIHSLHLNEIPTKECISICSERSKVVRPSGYVEGWRIIEVIFSRATRAYWQDLNSLSQAKWKGFMQSFYCRYTTAFGQKAVPRFGECSCCCCLPLLPGIACSIHATWRLPFSQALNTTCTAHMA